MGVLIAIVLILYAVVFVVALTYSKDIEVAIGCALGISIAIYFVSIFIMMICGAFEGIVARRKTNYSVQELINKHRKDLMSGGRTPEECVKILIDENISLKKQISDSANNNRSNFDESSDRIDLKLKLASLREQCAGYQNEIAWLKNSNRLLNLNLKEAEETNNALQDARSEYIASLEQKISTTKELLNERERFIEELKSGRTLSLFPFAAGLIADYDTMLLQQRADTLDWGKDRKRARKVESIHVLKHWAEEQVEKHKIASYQLQYLLALYPALQDVLDTDYCDLRVERDKIPEYDYTRDYLSKEEWAQLSESERNQLALDRYIESHNKTKWQIGRDYEMYIGYTYEQNGWTVQYTGIEMGFEDLGRDLIAQKDGKIEIVQCKYWSESKTIHEKHVMQLYGTVIAYQIQNPRVPPERINAVFITNIQLSDTARKFADVLDVHVREHVPKGDYPRIKCNIGKDEYGDKTYIYHLPMDLNYDSVKLDKPGECKVFTVKEAEDKGFRRALKWHSTE